MNTEQILTSISSLKSTVSVQQEQNAALISMAELLDSVFEHRTEVVSYRNLSHEELETVATEYDTLLNHLRNVFYSVSKIAMDNDAVFGDVTSFTADAGTSLGGAIHE